MEEKDIDLIDLYMTGALDAAATEAFKQRLAADKDFAQLYEDMRHLEKGLQHMHLKKAWEVIQQAEAGFAIARPAAKSGRRKVWLSIAASATLLVAAAAWYLLFRSAAPHDLFAQYFEVYPNVEAPIYRDSSAADSLTLKDQAFRRYADDDFEGAIVLFESIEVKDEGTRFYLGMSHLAKGDAEKAIEVFQNLRREAADYKTQIDWFLALALLKAERMDEARELLEELSASGTSYGERSRAILKAI